MDFERRAAKAYDRGDAVRAVILLVEGLKRHPDRRDAAETLVRYYADGLESPGLERDVVSGLVETSEAGEYLGRIYARLMDRGRDKMARDLERAADEYGYVLEMPAPPDETPAPDAPDPEAASKPSKVRETGPETEAGDPSSVPRPTVERSHDIETVDTDAPESERVRERLRSEPATLDETSSSPALREDSEPSDSSTRDRGVVDADSAPEPVTERPDTDSSVRRESPSTVRAVEPRGPSGPAEQRAEGSESGWLRRVGLAAAGVVAVAAVGYLLWTQIEALRAESSLDARLTSLDPNESVDFEVSELPSDAVRERRDFVDALRALERGETHSMSGEPTTAWGWSARAMSALTRDDLEAAVRDATKLERTYPDDDLARVWTQARVAEYRGDIQTAAEIYRRGRGMYPEFVPFLTGALRVAFMRFDREAVDRLVERLTVLSSDHPYRRLAEVPFPRVGEPGRSVGAGGGESAESERDNEPRESAFIDALRTYREALAALHDGQFEQAVDRAGRLVSSRDHFGPAILVRAAARAALVDVEAADADFGRLVELPGLSRRYQWQLRWVAPTMLTAAGRPDLGAKYVVSDGPPIPNRPRRLGEANGGDDAPNRESIVSRTSRWDEMESSGQVSEELASLKRKATMARVRVLNELGHHGRARRRLDGLRERSEEADAALAVLEAEIDARRGRRPAGPGEWARESASREARLVDAFYTGRFDRVIELGAEFLDEQPSMDVVRYVALSYAATDRGRQALRTLEQADLPVLARPALDRIRARIVSRLWKRQAPRIRGLGRIEALEPTSTRAAVDLAAILLWKHRVDAAETRSDEARQRAPDYPEANWIRGLVSRLRDDGDAERFLARSWRADGDGARLSMELGYVNLGLGRDERARDLFYSALMADPTSVEAIRGLGRAYLRYSAREGRWNFERFLENYDGKSSQAAEVLRWLGVFHGVRDGDAEGKGYLDRAVERAGRRPLLLVELARYHEARGEGEQARRLYVDTLKRDSTVAAAHLGLARVAGVEDDTETMRTHLNRYLDLQPAGRRAEWAREKLDELETSADE